MITCSLTKPAKNINILLQVPPYFTSGTIVGTLQQAARCLVPQKFQSFKSWNSQIEKEWNVKPHLYSHNKLYINKLEIRRALKCSNVALHPKKRKAQAEFM